MRGFINFALGIFLIAGSSLIIKTATDSARVFCYWGSWRPEVLNYLGTNTCTHIIYSFLTVANDGRVTGDLQTFAGLKSRIPGVKLLIAAGGWNDPPEKYSAIAADPTKRENFAASVLNLISQNNLDGFDLDWEYPVFREGRTINSADKTNIILLLQKLRSTFASRPGTILSAAVAACEYQASQSYDISQLSQNLDFINLMTYDLHGPWEAQTGLHSALYNDPASVDTCVSYWINNGAQTSKIILGIPSYGKSWTLADANKNTVGAATVGAGNAGPVTQEAGTLAYHEICVNNWQKVFSTPHQVPYAFNGNQWVGFEDVQSVGVKADYVKTRGLGGAMFWSLENDDYENSCGGGSFPLVKAAYNKLVGSVSPTNPPATTAAPVTTKAPTTTAKPTTKAPTTTARPTTKAPTTTSRPTTKAPTTTARSTTKAPTTKAPTTTAKPTTKAPTTSAKPTTKAPSSGAFVCPSDGYFKDPTNCNAFYNCANGVAYRQFCSSGLCFNPTHKVCDWCTNVTGCF